MVRGLPAARGAGTTRRRHAEVRPDEAKGAIRPADQRRAIRLPPAPPGKSDGRCVRASRCPQSSEISRARARAAVDPRPRKRRDLAVWTDTSQYLYKIAENS